jgi:hypothetical protein
MLTYVAEYISLNRQENLIIEKTKLLNGIGFGGEPIRECVTV